MAVQVLLILGMGVEWLGLLRVKNVRLQSIAAYRWHLVAVRRGKGALVTNKDTRSSQISILK
jgi:hypothetical protein